MSVAVLSADELGVWAAIATHLKLLPFKESVQTAELISISNCAAYTAQYNDIACPVDADEIERIALGRMWRKDFSSGAFGPFIYNTVTNDGVLYLGELAAGTYDNCAALVADVVKVSEAVEKWFRAERARMERQAEDDEAFIEVGPLPVLTADELKTEMAKRGAQRIIYAEFRVDESESQTDYFGGRSGRRVVIGFGTGKRESFKQLREAAALFPSTAEYAPGCDSWTVSAFRDPVDQHGYAPRIPLQNSRGHTMVFATKPDAERYVANLFATHPECQDDYAGCIGFPALGKSHGVEYNCESYENRENYSMGGGNYLGKSRYGGWQVSSTCYVNESCEYFDAPKVETPKRRGKSKAVRDLNALFDKVVEKIEAKRSANDDYAANV